MSQLDWLEPEIMRIHRETALFAEKTAELADILAADWPFFELQLRALCTGSPAEAPFTVAHGHLLYHGAYLLKLVGHQPDRVIPCALPHAVNEMVASKLKRNGWKRRPLPDAIAFDLSCAALTTINAEYVRTSNST